MVEQPEEPEETEETEKTEGAWSVAGQPLWWHLSFGIGGALILGFIAASGGSDAGGGGILGFFLGSIIGRVIWKLAK